LKLLWGWSCYTQMVSAGGKQISSRNILISLPFLSPYFHRKVESFSKGYHVNC
jgi:hypothetical protein